MIRIHKFPLLALLCLIAATNVCGESTPGQSKADSSQQWVFPKDAGIVNVRNFGAKGDGKTDDTQALRKAVNEALTHSIRYGAPRFIYLPNGTYRVTGPIESRVLNTNKNSDDKWNRWRAGFNMIGQSQDGVVIKLANRAEGYDNPDKPKGVIVTGSEAENAKQNRVGAGNRAFRHYIRNLTVDTGMENPGAVGIDYVVSNRGAIEDVTVKTSDPNNAGYAGIRMERAWPGPAMLKGITVDGFDYGMTFAQYEYGMTLENITLSDQQKAGLLNTHNAIYLLNLHSDNDVPAIIARKSQSLVTLINSTLEGGSADQAAISYEGTLFARNVKVAGYGKAIDDRRPQSKARVHNVPGNVGTVKEYASDTLAVGTDEQAAHSLDLPIKPTPDFNTNDLSKWTSVTDHGATVTPEWGDPGQKDDDTAGIQAAIDSGAQVVYLPNGTYFIEKPIIIRGNVRKLIGMGASINGRGKGNPVLRFDGGGGEFTVIEHIRVNGRIVDNSKKTLVLRHVDMKNGYRNTDQGTGDLFVEDVISDPLHINAPQSAWIRQLDTEWGKTPWLQNHGGTVWLLGHKTEGKTTAIETTDRGQTELLGALYYREPRWGGPKRAPLFSLTPGSRFSATYVNNGHAYPTQLAVKPADDTDDIAARNALETVPLGAIPWGRGPGLLLAAPQAKQK